MSATPPPRRRRTGADPQRIRRKEATPPILPAKDPRAADPEPGDERRVTLAAVTGAHGLAGEVRLKLFTEDLAAYPALLAGERRLTPTSVRPGPNGAVARFAEVTDRTAAEALRGTLLTVSRTTLPPLGDDEYYHADLIGLPAVASDGVPLGEVVAVENFGAGDVLEIARPDGRTFMVAMTAEAVPEWRPRVVIDPAFIT